MHTGTETEASGLTSGVLRCMHVSTAMCTLNGPRRSTPSTREGGVRGEEQDLAPENKGAALQICSQSARTRFPSSRFFDRPGGAKHTRLRICTGSFDLGAVVWAGDGYQGRGGRSRVRAAGVGHDAGRARGHHAGRRQHADRAAEPRGQGRGLRDLRQVRVPEPGREPQGSARAQHAPARRGGRPQAGRHHRRGDERQHRRVARAARGGARATSASSSCPTR